ncbi:MAG: DNA-directed RNA polymerase subunit beta, partial [Eubacteriales bacterium]
DDVKGRVKAYEAIVKGQNIPTAGVPAAFKVLVKELQALSLDVRVMDNDLREINLKDYSDDTLDERKYSEVELGENVMDKEIDNMLFDDESAGGDADDDDSDGDIDSDGEVPGIEGSPEYGDSYSGDDPDDGDSDINSDSDN